MRGTIKDTTLLEEYLNQSLDSYIKNCGMNFDGTWATEAEIFATANIIGIDVEIFCKNGNQTEWLRYPASFQINKTSSFALYLESENQNHFNVVLDV